MKKILVLLLMIFAAQGSLLLGSDNLENLYLTSPLRKICTGWLNQHVWNMQEQNDACKKLSAQYDFFTKELSVLEYFKSVENDRERRDKCLQKIEADFSNNALLNTGTWDLIGKILPQANAERKRIELEELTRLKFNLANIKRQRELRSVVLT